MSQQPGDTSGDVQQEQQALHQEAQEAQAAFAGAAGEPGAAGAVESEADAPLSSGQTQSVDTGAPERAREQQEAGDGGRTYEEPSTGQMLASEIASEPSMKMEGAIAEKLTGAEGETAPE